MIPTFRSARHLAVTLESVLGQDPGHARMQIEVVDDCSPGEDPAITVGDLVGDRVSVFRQERNVGHVENFNTCLVRARGRLVHLLHGDDAVRPGFYSTMERPFLEHKDVGAAFCRYIAMDEDGHWTNVAPLEASSAGVLPDWLGTIASGQRLQPPAMVVRRELYEQLGGFDRRIARYGEDWEMWTRIAAQARVWYEPEPLALYRVHSTSLSASSRRTGQNMRDLRRVIEINRAVLPPERERDISRQALEASARAAVRRGNRLVIAGDLRGALHQGREAVRASQSPPVLLGTAMLVARIGRLIGRRVSGRRVSARPTH